MKKKKAVGCIYIKMQSVRENVGVVGFKRKLLLPENDYYYILFSIDFNTFLS